MGVLDYVSDRVSDLFSFQSRYGAKKLKKRKEPQTVEIRVRVDCEGFERKVKKAVQGMKGVTKTELNRKQYNLTVIGYVDPNKVLKRVRRKTEKKAAFWPYVPYNVVPRCLR